MGSITLTWGGVELSVPQNLAEIRVLPEQDPTLTVEVTVDTIRTELQSVDADYAWNVRETAHMVLSVIFPSREALWTLS